MTSSRSISLFFFFNDTATTEIYTLSLHDALPILSVHRQRTPTKSAMYCSACLFTFARRAPFMTAPGLQKITMSAKSGPSLPETERSRSNLLVMFIVDAHLDLSMNAMEWNRDLRKTVNELRQREKGMKDKQNRGKAVVSFPELRKGDIGLVVATQIARYVAPGNPLPGWNSPEQAWAQTQGQLAWYKTMEEAGELFPVTDLPSLEQHLKTWNGEPAKENKPIGYIRSLEGADSLVTIGYLEKAYKDGLRGVGPAHYGPGRYAQGTDATGFMGPKGHALLKEMERLNMILDATHLCDDSFWEALDHFHGPVWASHNNCRSLVNHNRQFSDEQIKELI